MEKRLLRGVDIRRVSEICLAGEEEWERKSEIKIAHEQIESELILLRKRRISVEEESESWRGRVG